MSGEIPDPAPVIVLSAADRRRERARRIARLLSALLAAVLIIDLTIRDRFPVLSVVFYATPFPVQTLWISVVAWVWWRAGWRKLAGMWAAGALLAMACLVYQTFIYSPPAVRIEGSTAPVRVMFWNVARTEFFRDRIAPDILKHSAEIVGLVEAGPSTDAQIAFWRKAFPDWSLSDLRSGMLLLSRGPITEEARLELGDGGRCRRFILSVRGRRMRILLVDIKSNPFLRRREPLEALDRHVRSLADEPLVIMGDFNTPGDSVWFESLRDHCRNAFEVAGRGYRPTWPVPVPVLRLDHIWCNAAVTPIRAWHEWSIASDHRAVIAEIVPVSPH